MKESVSLLWWLCLERWVLALTCYFAAAFRPLIYSLNHKHHIHKFSFPHNLLLCSLPSVGPVPGRLVPRHSWSRSCFGGWGVVWGQEWRPHSHLPEEWLRPGQEPWIQSGQKEHVGQQGHQELREVELFQQVLPPSSINCECLLSSVCSVKTGLTACCHSVSEV